MPNVSFPGHALSLGLGEHRGPALANEKTGCPVKSEFQTMNTLLAEVKYVSISLSMSHAIFRT